MAGASAGRADLHTHSTASDGLDSPASLVRLARERGIFVLALTDHDTTSGVAEAEAAATEHGIRFVPGVEFSARAPRGETHILGYGIDPDDRLLDSELNVLRLSREERGTAMLARLRELGITLPQETLISDRPGHSPGRPHIARALVEAGVVASVQQAFDEYLAIGRPAFLPRRTITAERAIQVIHGSGGIAVLAHPFSVYQLERVLPRLVAAGLDGLEVHYGEYDQDQRRSLADLASAYNLLMSGGSDYHGATGVAGRALGSVDWPADCLRAILERLK